MMKYKQLFHKYIKNYRFNSIFFKNLVSLIPLIIIPIIGIITILFYAYGNIQKNEIKAYNEEYITKLSGDVDRIIKEAGSQLAIIGFNSTTQLFMYTSGNDSVIWSNSSFLTDLIKFPVIGKDYVNSVYLYSPRSGKVVTMSGIVNYDNFTDKACIEEYINHDNIKASQWFALTDMVKKGVKVKQLSVYNNIYLGSLNSGVAVMNLNLTELGKMLAGGNDHFYIIDNEQILYSRNQDEIGKSVEIIPNYKRLLKNEGYFDKETSISLKTSKDTGIKVITYFDFEVYRSKLIGIRNFMFLFVLVMTIIIVILCFVISVRIFNPIKTIMSTIEENKAALFGDDDILNEQNELKYIVNSIKKTINKNRNIEEELTERVRLLKKAQSVALQSQINPHFFNNTLETINWMAIGLFGGENDISNMAGALSSMLRMALENTDTIIPLRDELEHSKLYIEIQKKRYEDKFNIVWDMPEELLDCKTIKIVLQPIIENAIYHGIKPLTNKGMITVSGRIIAGDVEITVKDNGLGISPSEVYGLNQSMKSEVIKESRHIGLINVNQRLKLYFGEEYGLKIESIQNIKTEVIMKFPVIK
ncbi:two-component system, sensor histidine kinase YesM [Anaerocolumna jejuensis DSM 15929]|uniref:Two-component system, sensor histidine kinase YesM n=1 Tax=Anaerocolumna jejuensis DSM 15929 TaxID=1121322 RepID=A0A1M6VTI9_9FIRM|nr:histidine kinase [Anaerocolumna jejuensis]SHK84635.1 two-component system, sensor histidine kinase YesM [Anaerocolumna jejuensis DSM 15929]